MTSGLRQNPPTIADVAHLAGVSNASAARVLNPTPGRTVNPEMSQRVRDAARQLGYVPNALASRLRGGGVPSIGLIIGDIIDPYFGEIAESVTAAADARSHMALVANVRRDPQRELDYFERLWSQRVRGLIMAGGGFDQAVFSRELEELVTRAQQSGVMVASLAPRPFEVTTFTADNRAAGRMAARVLLEQGHTEVGAVMGSALSFATIERLDGVVTELEAAGAKAHIVRDVYSAGTGAHAVDELLKEAPGISAFIGGSGTVTIGVAQRLGDLGFSIPESFSLVGIGGTVLTARLPTRITSIELHLAESAQAAVEYIVNGAPDSTGLSLTPSLVEGVTVGLPRAQK